jgi:hypothetical protein
VDRQQIVFVCMIIVDILRKHQEGLRLSPEDLQVARAALKSRNTREKIAACEVLISSYGQQNDRKEVTVVLVALCSRRRLATGLRAELVRILVLLPPATFEQNHELQEFVCRAALSEEPCCQINATGLLALLTTLGNEKARELLVAAARVGDPYVRHNAVHYLGIIRSRER